MNSFEKMIELLKRQISNLNDDIEKYNTEKQVSELAQNIVSKCNDCFDLTSVDIKDIERLDIFLNTNYSNFIKRAMFIFERCRDIDISNQPQYIQIRNELEIIFKNIKTFSVGTILNLDVIMQKISKANGLLESVSANGFDKLYEDFDFLSEFLQSNNFSKTEINEILINLLKVNTNVYLKKGNVKAPILEEKSVSSKKIIPISSLEDVSLNLPKKTETALESEEKNEPVMNNIEENTSMVDDKDTLLSDTEFAIYENAKQILAANKDEIRVLEIQLFNDNFYQSYLTQYNAALNDFEYEQYFGRIPTNYLKLIILKSIEDMVAEIDNCLEISKTSDIAFNADYVKMSIAELDKMLGHYNDYIFVDEKVNHPVEAGSIKDIIFLNEAISDFESNSLREVRYRNHILGGINQLLNGDMSGAIHLENVSSKIKIFKKACGINGRNGVQITYMPLKNDIIAILGMSTLQDSHKYRGDVELLATLLHKSEDYNSRKDILAINSEFREYILTLIEEKEKGKGGFTNA